MVRNKYIMMLYLKLKMEKYMGEVFFSSSSNHEIIMRNSICDKSLWAKENSATTEAIPLFSVCCWEI